VGLGRPSGKTIAWLARIGISLIPVIITLSRPLQGIEWGATAAEAVGIYVYLSVVVGSENLVLKRKEIQPHADRYVPIFQLFVALLLWVAVFIAVGARPEPLVLTLLGALGITWSSVILRSDYSRHCEDYEKEREEIRREQMARLKTKRDETTIGGGKIDL